MSSLPSPSAPSGPSRSPSLWRLSAMVLGLLVAALLLVWILTTLVLSRAFDEFGRSVVLDDLGEYRAVYERDGVDAVRSMFEAGRHEGDQVLRIVGADGKVLVEEMPRDHRDWAWPVRRPEEPGAGEVSWIRHRMGDGTTLTVGGSRLAGGGALWFGRSNVADLATFRRLGLLMALCVGATALLAMGPVVWFANHVLRPVRALRDDARRLVRGGPTIQRLAGPGAIPELEELADAFNEALDRVKSLTEELEAANDQLAHELRTPLARVRGNVERVLAAPGDEQVREGAGRALDEIERATRLIQSILTIRAGEARSMRLQRVPLAVADLVADAVDLYQPAAEARGLTLEWVGPGAECRVEADPDRLRQALCGLLDNALAYTPSGGRVKVGVRVDAITARIWVADTGPGLRGDDAERIWNRFVRGTAASAAVSGLGLGLSVVRSILVAHGGHAGAGNRPEGGAEFWLELPRMAGSGMSPAAPGAS